MFKMSAKKLDARKVPLSKTIEGMAFQFDSFSDLRVGACQPHATGDAHVSSSLCLLTPCLKVA